MVVFGITGTLGAGKGSIVSYLAQKGFDHYSVREFLIEEIKRKGLPVNRDSMNMVGESLREQHGASFVIDTLYDRAKEKGRNAIIESVRTVGEVESLKQKGGYLIAIDADPRVRYERVLARKSETDSVSYEKFLSDEARESVGEDPARMNLKNTMALADFSIFNNTSLENLYRQIDVILATVSQT